MNQEMSASTIQEPQNPNSLGTNATIAGKQLYKLLRATILGIRKIEALPVIIVLVALYVTFMIKAPDVFRNYPIYLSFLRTVSPPLILGLGLTLVIAAGEIDLSFPAVVAFSGYALTWGYEHFADPLGPDLAPWAAVALALAAGGLIGLINGIMVAKLNIPSIMATLAAQFFWYGVTLVLAEGLTLRLAGVRDNIIHEVFVRRIEGIVPVEGRAATGIPAQSLWALALAIALWLILNRHKFGEAIMFVGDNPDVARVMGINVDMTRIKLFTLMGIISGLAGVILTLEITVFYPTQGNGFLLLVMAAVFIGGTSIAGGHGSIVGTFFGAFIIISLEPGIVAMKINGYWVRLIEGAVLAGSVLLHVLIKEENLAMAITRIRGWSMSIQGMWEHRKGGPLLENSASSKAINDNID